MVLVPVRHTKAVVFQDRFYILPGSSGLMAEEGCFSVVLLQGVGLQWLIFDSNFTISACYFFPIFLSKFNARLSSLCWICLYAQVVRSYTYVSNGGVPNCISSCLELNAGISPGLYMLIN